MFNFYFRYVENIKKVAQLTKDQPMTGLEKAVWWTEYVIRHRGAPHFKNPLTDMPTYQAYLLDVIGFIFVFTIILIYLCYKLFTNVKYVFRKVIIYNKLKSS